MIAVFTPGAFLRADDIETGKALEQAGARVVFLGDALTQVHFRECNLVGEAELRLIGQLSKLRHLTLYGRCKALTDETLPLLSSLQNLESFGVDGAQISDEGLARLVQFKSLRSLSLFHVSFQMPGFTGVGLRQLKDIPRLESLTLAGMSIGDDAFAAIAEITQLKQLSTWHTWQTEAGNAEIAKLPNLQSLRLGQRLPRRGIKAPSLSDSSISHLLRIQSLERLKIGEAYFSVERLKALAGLANLKKLSLHETPLSDTELESLRSALPGVEVEFTPLTEEQRRKLQMYHP